MREEGSLEERVGQAQRLAIRGDRDAARAAYAALWTQATGSGDPYWACVIAHLMAAIQPTPAAQLTWHQRALEVAEGANDARVRTFYPSLHANLADTYLRLGNGPQAQRHIQHAQAATDTLAAEDAYRATLQAWIARLTEALADNPAPGGENG